jgi:hypothetical protein
MKGCLVVDAKILSMLPRVKIKVTAMRNPRMAFAPTDHMIALGSVSDASRISSAVIYISYQHLMSLEKVEGRNWNGVSFAYTCGLSNRTQ